MRGAISILASGLALAACSGGDIGAPERGAPWTAAGSGAVPGLLPGAIILWKKT